MYSRLVFVCLPSPPPSVHIPSQTLILPPIERDSLKDRTIVTIFLLATTSLLLWALLKPFIITPSTSDLVQKYGDRMGIRVGEDDDGLPGPGAGSSSGGGGGRGGFGRDVSPGRRARTGVGARGSISRQGGLNS